MTTLTDDELIAKWEAMKTEYASESILRSEFTRLISLAKRGAAVDSALTKAAELMAAAHYDMECAKPNDVGMSGLPIKQWRQAYDEGCRDMAGAIIGKFDTVAHETTKQRMNAEYKRLSSPQL